MRMDTRTACSSRFWSCCVTCITQFYPSSCGQPINHGQNPVGHALKFGVNFGQRVRWLENVEVAVEWDFIAHFGLVWVNPSIGGVGQRFALEVVDKVFIQRRVFGVALAAIRNWYAVAFGFKTC